MIPGIPFHTYLDLLPLNLVYFVLENSNFVLEKNISSVVGTMINLHSINCHALIHNHQYVLLSVNTSNHHYVAVY